MEPISTVRSRQTKVRWGVAAFIVGLLLHVVATNYVFFVWLGGEEFATRENAVCLAWMAGLVLTVCFVQFLFLNRSGARIAEMLGAVRLETAVAEHPSLADKARQVQNILDELCIAGSCSRPRVFVLTGERQVNAFAAGFSPSDWCIAISHGALENLPRSEMQALLAHELAHLRLLDTRNVLFLAATIGGLIAILSFGAIIAYLTGGSREGLLVAIIGLAIAIFGLIGGLVAIVLEAAVSRQQEFRADAEAVRLCRDSQGMVELLKRLARQSLRSNGGAFDRSQPGVAGMLLRSMNFDHPARKGLFDSHPPLVARIHVFDPAAAAEVAQWFAERE